MRIDILEKLIVELEQTSIPLYMASYIGEQECGTVMCIAGRIPLVDKEFAKAYLNDAGSKLDYHYTSMSEFVVDHYAIVWDFLFSEVWEDDIDAAIARLKHVIEFQDVPKIFSDKYEYEILSEQDFGEFGSSIHFETEVDEDYDT